MLEHVLGVARGVFNDIAGDEVEPAIEALQKAGSSVCGMLLRSLGHVS